VEFLLADSAPSGHGAVRCGGVVASVGSSGGRAKRSGWSKMGGPIMVLSERVGLPKARESKLKTNGNKKQDSKPEKAHCLTGAANLYDGQMVHARVQGMGRRDSG